MVCDTNIFYFSENKKFLMQKCNKTAFFRIATAI